MGNITETSHFEKLQEELEDQGMNKLRKRVEKQMKERQMEIAEKLRETGYKDIMKMINGLQEELKLKDGTIKNLDEQFKELYIKNTRSQYKLDEIERILDRRVLDER